MSKTKPKPTVDTIAQKLATGKLLVNHAYQAYQLVKEQCVSQNINYTDEDVAIAVQKWWPHLFAEL